MADDSRERESPRMRVRRGEVRGACFGVSAETDQTNDNVIFLLSPPRHCLSRPLLSPPSLSLPPSLDQTSPFRVKRGHGSATVTVDHSKALVLFHHTRSVRRRELRRDAEAEADAKKESDRALDGEKRKGEDCVG